MKPNSSVNTSINCVRSVSQALLLGAALAAMLPTGAAAANIGKRAPSVDAAGSNGATVVPSATEGSDSVKGTPRGRWWRRLARGVHHRTPTASAGTSLAAAKRTSPATASIAGQSAESRNPAKWLTGRLVATKHGLERFQDKMLAYATPPAYTFDGQETPDSVQKSAFQLPSGASTVTDPPKTAGQPAQATPSATLQPTASPDETAVSDRIVYGKAGRKPSAVKRMFAALHRYAEGPEE